MTGSSALRVNYCPDGSGRSHDIQILSKDFLMDGDSKFSLAASD